MSRKFNIRELDFNEAGQWPAGIKIGFWVITAGLVVLLSWLLLTSGKRDELQGLESTERGLRDKYSVVAVRALQLEPLKKQMDELKTTLQVAVRQLPSKTEMPSLIMDISQMAHGSGLRNELFQPEPESVKEFYAETPISVRMAGQYHQFGEFVGSIASLQRLVIMTMEDITMVPGAQVRDSNDQFTEVPMVLTAKIKTYRYLDEDEAKEQEEKAAEAAKQSAKAAAAKSAPAAEEEMP